MRASPILLGLIRASTDEERREIFAAKAIVSQKGQVRGVQKGLGMSIFSYAE
jgi:hypothetical protein